MLTWYASISYNIFVNLRCNVTGACVMLLQIIIYSIYYLLRVTGRYSHRNTEFMTVPNGPINKSLQTITDVQHPSRQGSSSLFPMLLPNIPLLMEPHPALKHSLLHYIPYRDPPGCFLWTQRARGENQSMVGDWPRGYKSH